MQKHLLQYQYQYILRDEIENCPTNLQNMTNLRIWPSAFLLHHSQSVGHSMTTAMAFAAAQTILFTRHSLLLHKNSFKGFSLSAPSFLSSCFSSSSSALSSDQIHRQKWRSPVVSVLELGGVKVAKEGYIPISKS